MRKSGPIRTASHLFAETNAGVVAFGDDVGQGMIDDEFDLDVGVTRQQLGERRPENGFGGVLAGGDADVAGGLFPQFAQRGQFGIDLVETRADVTQQAFTCFGRRDAARGACQQPDPEPLLEPADGVTERRL